MNKQELINRDASNESGARADFIYGNMLDQKRYIYALNLIHKKLVLDCACGVGWGTNLMANAGAQKVIGLDISPAAIFTANKYYRTEKVAYRCETPDQIEDDLKFDIITTFETLEHVEHPVEFLRSLRKLSHQGTTCLLSTPNGFCFKNEKDNPYNPYHFKEYTKDELLNIFMRSGWRVAEYKGQHPMRHDSAEIFNYRKFIRRYWRERIASDKYGISYKIIKRVLKKIGLSSPLNEPAYQSDCSPVAIEDGFQPAYHFFILSPSV